jgi:hypothetical protein
MLGASCSPCCSTSTANPCNTLAPYPLPDLIEVSISSGESDYASYALQTTLGSGGTFRLAVAIAYTIPSGTFQLTHSSDADYDFYYNQENFRQTYWYVNDVLGLRIYAILTSEPSIQLQMSLLAGRMRTVTNTLEPLSRETMLSDSWADSQCLAGTIGNYPYQYRECVIGRPVEVALFQRCYSGEILEKQFSVLSGAGNASACFSGNCIPPASISGSATAFSDRTAGSAFDVALHGGKSVRLSSPADVGRFLVMSKTNNITTTPESSPNTSGRYNLSSTLSFTCTVNSVKVVRGSDKFDLFPALPTQAACCGSYNG